MNTSQSTDGTEESQAGVISDISSRSVDLDDPCPSCGEMFGQRVGSRENETLPDRFGGDAEIFRLSNGKLGFSVTFECPNCGQDFLAEDLIPGEVTAEGYASINEMAISVFENSRYDYEHDESGIPATFEEYLELGHIPSSDAEEVAEALCSEEALHLDPDEKSRIRRAAILSTEK